MISLVNLFWIPLLSLITLLFPAQPALQAETEPQVYYQAEYEVPPVDSPFYGDFFWQRPRVQRVLPKVDFDRLKQEFAAEPEEYRDIGKWFQLLGNQLGEQDWNIVLTNYPRLGLVYNAETGEASGLTDEGVFHLGFCYNIKTSLFYPTLNPWMRVMGFNKFYDWLGHALRMFDYDTRRVRFEYEDLDYQVQLWKGKYFFSTCMGAELGFYTKPQSRRLDHYDCLPLRRMMPMSLKLYNERDIYFDLPPVDHWWPVMLAHRPPRISPHLVTLESSIDFAKDPGLGEAFYAALAAQCPDFEMTKEDDLVWLRWNATESVLSIE